MIFEVIINLIAFSGFLLILVLDRKTEARIKKRKKEIDEKLNRQNELIKKQNELFIEHSKSLEHVKEIFRRESQK